MEGELSGFLLEPTQERIATQEEREYLDRILGSLGLYNAAFDTYPTTEHPEDERWRRDHER